MKKLIGIFILCLTATVSFILPVEAQEVTENVISKENNFLWDLIMDNAAYILPVIIWLVNRLIPTKWQDPVIRFLNFIFGLIPDVKKGGGSHNIKTK